MFLTLSGETLGAALGEVLGAGDNFSFFVLFTDGSTVGDVLGAGDLSSLVVTIKRRPFIPLEVTVGKALGAVLGASLRVVFGAGDEIFSLDSFTTIEAASGATTGATTGAGTGAAKGATTGAGTGAGISTGALGVTGASSVVDSTASATSTVTLTN